MEPVPERSNPLDPAAVEAVVERSLALVGLQEDLARLVREESEVQKRIEDEKRRKAAAEAELDELAEAWTGLLGRLIEAREQASAKEAELKDVEETADAMRARVVATTSVQTEYRAKIQALEDFLAGVQKKVRVTVVRLLKSVQPFHPQRRNNRK